MYACAYSLVFFVIFSFIRKATRLDFRKIMRALDLGARNAAPISAACATAGLIIGIITMTGFAMKLSNLVTDMAGTSLFLGLFFMMVASLILGMGLPPVASYIILAALGAPILSRLGAPLLSLHMFIFYFGTLSTITPPVCVAAYAGAGIAQSDPMKTGFMATRLAFVAFVVPYHMVYYPSLILRGSVIEIVSITLTVLLGIFSFAVFLEGFLSTRITPGERVLILLASVFFFWPSLWHFMVGIALLGSVTYYNRTRASKLISQSNIECPAVSSSRNT
jgi:TRAP transporter 4TM/12TM fusion protein